MSHPPSSFSAGAYRACVHPSPTVPNRPTSVPPCHPGVPSYRHSTSRYRGSVKAAIVSPITKYERVGRPARLLARRWICGEGGGADPTPRPWSLDLRTGLGEALSFFVWFDGWGAKGSTFINPAAGGRTGMSSCIDTYDTSLGKM